MYTTYVLAGHCSASFVYMCRFGRGRLDLIRFAGMRFIEIYLPRYMDEIDVTTPHVADALVEILFDA